MNSKTIKSLSALSLISAILTGTVQSAEYNAVDLGTLGGGSSQGSSINASGQVAGSSTISGGATHAFLYDGAMHDLGTMDGGSSSGSGISNDGHVVGTSSGSAERAFLYDGAMHDLGTLDPQGRFNSNGYGISPNGVYTTGKASTESADSHAFRFGGLGKVDLGTLPSGGPSTEGLGVNDSGEVTGDALSSDFLPHAFFYDGTMHDLGTFGGALSGGRSINANGIVVGYAEIADHNNSHAFLYDGTMHDLGTLGGPDSAANSINSTGQVTGYSRTSEFASASAFVYDPLHGGLRDLNTLIDPSLGWHLTSGTGINDRGQITGVMIVGNETHAFLLTPVPEPSGLILAALACACVGFWNWRRWGYTASGARSTSK